MGTGSGDGIASLTNGCIQVAIYGYIGGVWNGPSGNNACVVTTTPSGTQSLLPVTQGFQNVKISIKLDIAIKYPPAKVSRDCFYIYLNFTTQNYYILLGRVIEWYYGYTHHHVSNEEIECVVITTL